MPNVRRLEEARSSGYTHFPVVLELFGDVYTPVGLYLKLRSSGKNSFLLESAEGGEKIGRYSFLGVDPFATFMVSDEKTTLTENGIQRKIDSHPVKALKEYFESFKVCPVDNLPRLAAGAVGFFGYDFVRYLENIPIVGSRNGLPEVFLNFYDTIVAVDNLKRRIDIVTLVPLAGNSSEQQKKLDDKIAHIQKTAALLENGPLPKEAQKLPAGAPKFNITKDAFEKNVEHARRYIVEGDVFQVVISQRAEFEYPGDPFLLYRGVRSQNPSPYMFYLEFSVEPGKRLAVIGSSPEMFVRKEGEIIEMRPIAGTRPRGATPDEDETLTRELLGDEKEKAEHVMLVDLGRNDIGRVAATGTVRVDNFMHVEKFSHVMHIVTDVSGKIDNGKDAVETLAACFPAGTLSGAPKVRAMEIITELEKDARQVYGGAVGYIDFNNNMDTCIAIRTFVVYGDKGYLQAGAGIVYDSDPEREYNETLNKMKANLEALKIIDRFQ